MNREEFSISKMAFQTHLKKRMCKSTKGTVKNPVTEKRKGVRRNRGPSLPTNSIWMKDSNIKKKKKRTCHTY